MTAAVIAVLADEEHPERDEWVDEQARTGWFDLGVPINDETYQGVWRWPTFERPLIHVFALTEDMPKLIEYGLKRDGDA